MNPSSIIRKVTARQIYDSRGMPTVECELTTDLGFFRASVPSGASTGKYEAHQLRDTDRPDLHLGKGVLTAVENIKTVINEALMGKDCRNQKQIDKLMVEVLDGSKNEYGWCKSKLGANAILGVSMAVCRAAAASHSIPLYAYIRSLLKDTDEEDYRLPCPAFNVINGGKHGGNELAMQEFMVMPTGASSFSEAMRIGSEIYHTLKGILKQRYGIGAINVGDQGGFAPPIHNHTQALELINEAIRAAKYEGKVHIAMDCAASEFYTEKQGVYDLCFKSKAADKKLLSTQQLLDVYCSEIVGSKCEDSRKYPVISIEDAFDQDDWDGWQKLTLALGDHVQIVGDDLLVTNLSRISSAINKKACNALLLKLNQIGTLTEALQAAQVCKQNGWGVMVSHRSGETEDTFIAHLAVGLGCGQIKTGAPCRSERLAKYNELLRIEEQLGQKGIFGGLNFLKNGQLKSV